MDTGQSPRRRRRMSLPTTLGGMFTVVVLALAGVTTASPAAAATGQITGIGGKCVDVAAANSANGTPIQLYDCNGSSPPAVDPQRRRHRARPRQVPGRHRRLHRQRSADPAVRLQRHHRPAVDLQLRDTIW
ncbi:hypothetical protein GCM10018952_23310 [Streptosporangium vulgare]